ncbi:MAG: DUF3137 domain-containing protein [Candidatus Izimaplasma sp.]|nr:DUF3137 domain-containing protein [Candidatus Izimaplasma bacterium]
MEEKLLKFQLLKKKSEKNVVIGGILLVLGLILFVLLIEYGPYGLILGLPGLVLIGIGFAKFSGIKKNFKSEVLHDVVVTFVEDGVFDPLKGLSQTVVYNTEFLKRADIFQSEDYLAGKMDGVSFVSSDVKLQERHVEHTENGTRTTYVTYFLGRVFRFEFNKSFDGYLQVLEKSKPTIKRKYKKIKLESVDFNKKFKTYSTSEHTAFYVLTPHLMEALRDFEKNNKGKISFSFIGKYLYIGINNFRDTFELKMFRVLNEETFSEFKRELFVIQEIVKELRLNNDIFKKE